MSVPEPLARAFYEAEAIHGGWPVRQLDRQVGTQFYERAVKSMSPGAMVARANHLQPGDRETVNAQVRDPYLLEFLNLKDEYRESDLEVADLQDLSDVLPELVEVRAKTNVPVAFRVEVSVGDGKDLPPAKRWTR